MASMGARGCAYRPARFLSLKPSMISKLVLSLRAPLTAKFGSVLALRLLPDPGPDTRGLRNRAVERDVHHLAARITSPLMALRC
jgi:hypothetical protein